MTVDLVVVGAGPGGLATAVTAARAGMSVALVDPLDRVGGNAAISTGYLAILGSDEQDAAGIEDTPELYLRDLVREVDQYRGHDDLHFDEELALDFVRRTPAVYRLLRELGFTFDGFVNRPAQYSVPRLLKVTDPGMFERLFRSECERLGIQLRLGHRVCALESVGGRIRTAVVEGPNGIVDGITAATGVVLASGGYQANGPMRRQAQPDLGDDAPFLGVPTCRGEGHRLIADSGGELVNMGFLPRIVMIGSALAEDVIAVGPDGLRFHDETGPSEERVRAVEKVSGPAHYIFDDAARQRYPDLVDQLPEPVAAAPTLGDLAVEIGCDGKGLVAAVDEWNATVASGATTDPFGRAIFPPTGAGIVAPPFHAAPCRVGSAFTIGGARTDSSARVLDRSGHAVPGLFAVGDCSGSLNAAAGTGGVHITSALAFGHLLVESLTDG